jgi:hypothetical protein
MFELFFHVLQTMLQGSTQTPENHPGRSFQRVDLLTTAVPKLLHHLHSMRTQPKTGQISYNQPLACFVMWLAAF